MKKVITIILIILIILIVIGLFLIVKYNQDRKNKTKIKNVLKSIYMKVLKNNRFVNNNIQSKINSIDHVYCVAMPQRRKYVESLFQQYNTNVTFFDAIKPDDITKGEYKLLSDTFNKSNKLMFRKMTKLPVHLSYTMCFIDALYKGYKNIILFEDDIVINVTKTKMEKSIQEFLASDFIMFYMGYCWPDTCDKSNYDTTTYQYLVEIFSKTLACNHAIVFKMEHISELLDFMYPMYNYTDDMFIDYFKKKDHKICVPRSSYFDQNRKDFGTLNDNYQNELPTCKF